MSKAYLCHNDYGGAIVFGDTRGKAKWDYINRYCDGDWSGVSCKRRRDLDRFESAKNIPFKELVYMGWWSECYQCGRHVEEGSLQDDDMDIEDVVGFYHGPVYCCPKCEIEAEKRREADRILENQVIREMLWKLEDRFPGATIELTKTYTQVNGDIGHVWEARLYLSIDGYSVRYELPQRALEVPTSSPQTLEDLKKTQCNLMIHENDLSYFEKTYKVKCKKIS